MTIELLDKTSSSGRLAAKAMRAAVIGKANDIRLAKSPPPSLEPGETLIRVSHCGICGSDIHVLKGEHPTARFPVIPGHEFIGEVVDVRGDGSDRLAKGDLVAAQPFFSCGNCEPCAKGRDNVCRSLRFMGVHTNGAFAEYVKAPTRKVYKLPQTINRKLAALAEPVAVAVHDVRRSGLKAGETAFVIGGGAIGLLLAIVARHSGARTVVISEINEYRRRLAGELGFATVNPLDADFDEQTRHHSGGLGFDVVFEASGSKAGVASSTKLAKITGKVMIIGMTREPYPVDLSAVFAKELVLEGVRIHSQYNFVGAVNLLASGALDRQFEKIVTDVYPLDRVEDAFALAQTNGDFIKILVEM